MNPAAPPELSTPIPLCNELLHLSAQVLKSEAPSARLRARVEQALGELAGAREQTLARIRVQGEEHLQRFAEPIAAVEESFRLMEVALHGTLRFAERPDPDRHEEAAGALRVAGFATFHAAQGYQHAELRQGPTEMPVLNMIYRLNWGLARGEASREELERAIQGAMDMARAAAEEARASSEAPAPEERERMAGAYGDFAEALQGALRAVEAGGQAVEDALHRATAAGRRVREAMEAYNLQATTGGPTPLPQVNLVLTLLESHQRGGLALEAAVQGVASFRKLLGDLQAEVEALASIPSESGAVSEQLGPIREAFEAHRRALDLFDRYLEGEGGAYTPARLGLIQAAEALAVCKTALEEIGQSEGRIPCMRCGASNDPAHRSCAGCGAQLILPGGLQPTSSSTMSFQEGQAGSVAGGELVMTDQLLRLFEAVNAVAEGRLSGSDFEALIDEFSDRLEEVAGALPEPPVLSREGLDEEEVSQLEPIEESLAQAGREIEEGFQELAGALGGLRRYPEALDKSCLVEGVRRVRDAAIRIQRAQARIDELAGASAASSRGGEALRSEPGPEEEGQRGLA